MVSFTSLTKSKTLPLFLNASFLILLSFYVTTTVLLPSKPTSLTFFSSSSSNACSRLHDYPDYNSKCAYVKAHAACRPKGYINYLEIFYCNCGRFPPLGGVLFTIWLLVLFYILGDTASDYFCPSVEYLSKFLNLSPIIAGTTLLPLGNGAPDVFASIISFTGSGNGNIGLNSVLGGAFFISTVVVGILCIINTSKEVVIDKPSFIRNILFLLFSLSFLLIIVTIGEINLWVTICFASIYILYVFVVSIMHCISSDAKHKVVNPAAVNTISFGEMGVPLLGCVDEEKCVLDEKNLMMNPKSGSERHDYIQMFRYILELPLYLPRRVTIPVVGDENWSKPFAVISVTLAPILLALVWNTQNKEMMSSKTRLVIYMTAGLVGLVSGSFAFVATNKDRPPKKCLWPWLAGGFVMSIAWTYIIAQELVSLLVSAGNISGLSSSILGLTVLAWGNSIGDLIAYVAMATHGGPNGAHIAISGCYAGPIFNILVGLGASLVLASWSEYPASFHVIPTDDHVYETIGFFMGALLWALVILPKNNMRLDRKLGVGLLAIYLCFLCLNFSGALGLLSSVGM